MGITGYCPPKEELDVFWEDCEPGHARAISRENAETPGSKEEFIAQ